MLCAKSAPPLQLAVPCSAPLTSYLYLYLLLWSFVLNKCHYFRITKGIVNDYDEKTVLKIIIVYLVLVMAIVTSLKWPRVSSLYTYIFLLLCRVYFGSELRSERSSANNGDIVETPITHIPSNQPNNMASVCLHFG